MIENESHDLLFGKDNCVVVAESFEVAKEFLIG